jgi:hypothetical protein
MLCIGLTHGPTAIASETESSVTQPRHVDVMLLFDTTSSMYDVAKEAAAKTDEVISKLSAQVPGTEFGLAEVRDAGGNRFDGEPGDVPWRLDEPVGEATEAIVNDVKGFKISGGGDSPEAYSRALWETVNNPTVGWRQNASHIIVLIADSIPHDNNLNEGIPPEDWVEPSSWDTGIESPEPYGVVGTTITPQTSLDWQTVLAEAGAAGFQLEVLAFAGEEGTLPYWENWASRTNGEAVLGEHGELAPRLLELLKRGAARACATVHGRIGKRLLAALRCEGALAPLAKVCGTPTITQQLLFLSDQKRTTGKGPLTRLLRAVKGAEYLRHANKGFASASRVIARMSGSRTAIGVLDLLPQLSKSVSRPGFEQIAALMAKARGVRSCAAGLLSAVH